MMPVSGMVLSLTRDPGEYRLGLFDVRTCQIAAVTRETRHMRIGDRWVIRDDVDHSLIALTAGVAVLEDPDQYTWVLVSAGVVR